MNATSMDWRLRPVTVADIDSLHALASLPPVYRYLFDGAAPSRAFIAGRVDGGIANRSTAELGLWVLCAASVPMAGCVELRPSASPGAAELTYLLDPGCWGQGLATRMAWPVIEAAFRSPQIGAVVAGADGPNAASQAVLRRLGMRFLRDVQYPLGAGAEYVLRRGDPGPTPPPIPIPLG